MNKPLKDLTTCVCNRCGGTGRIFVSESMDKVMQVMSSTNAMTVDEIVSKTNDGRQDSTHRVRHQLNKLVKCGLVEQEILTQNQHRRSGYILKRE